VAAVHRDSRQARGRQQAEAQALVSFQLAEVQALVKSQAGGAPAPVSFRPVEDQARVRAPGEEDRAPASFLPDEEIMSRAEGAPVNCPLAEDQTPA
jgi:hypothetical protein